MSSRLNESQGVVERDNRKKILCEENSVKLLYFSDKNYDENIITDGRKLIEKICKE